MFKKWKETFRPESSFKVFLMSILFVGIGYGIYKGVLDNYLAEVVGIGEFGRGAVEFFREIPGLLLVLVLALLFMLSAVLGLCNSAYAATIKTKKKSTGAGA